MGVLSKNRGSSLAVLLLFSLSQAGLLAQLSSWRQTEADSYTRYELLDPSSQSFRILYDVSATTPGTQVYFNTLRAGSEHQVDSVVDLMSGKKLEWEIVTGEEAIQTGIEGLRPEGEYLKVQLARPVPAGGESRIRIDKTYKDPASYNQDGSRLVFQRSLGIKRNSVVLPGGYELIGSNYPSQVDLEADGRMRVSFINRGPAPVPYKVTARLLDKRSPAGASPAGGPPAPAVSTVERNSAARPDFRFSQRAFQDREIVYFLEQPETHSFRLYHDYTESREGVDRYLNVVRQGSRVSNPSAILLDTGERLKVETLKGEKAILDRGIEIASVGPDTEVVVIWFEPVGSGKSVRLRIEETYTDPSRYLRRGDELIWDRGFGRSQNAVLLPQGWYLTASAVPAVISEDDGRIRLDFVNDRPGNLQVFIRARHR